jgi:hypothetical protein
MVVCVHCGKEHDSQAKFCPQTGKALTPSPPPVAAARPASANAAAARATKLMYLPPEARLPGAALPRPPARTEMMNAQGPIVAPAAPRSLVTAPAAAAGTIGAALPDATVANPIIPGLAETISSPTLNKLAAGAAAPAADATIAMPTLPHWDEPAADDESTAADEPAAAQPAAANEPAAPVGNQTVKAATISGAVSGHGPTAVQETSGAVAAAIAATGSGATSGAISGARARPVPAAAVASAPSMVIDPSATMPAGGGEDAVPAVVPMEKSDPESWVTAPRPGDSPATRSRRQSQPGSPTTPASALPSGGKSMPSWAALPSADDMRRPSAVFTAFEGPKLDFVALVRKTGLFYWANRLPLLIIAAVLLGPVSLLTSGMMAGLGRNGSLERGFVAILLGFLVSLLMMGLAWPVTSAAISLAVIHRLQGGNIEPGREYGLCFRRLLPLASAMLPASLLIAIGYFLLVIPGLAASLFFALVPVVVLLEGKSGIDALKRSALVMKDLIVRALGVLAVFVVVSLVVRKVITLAVPGNGVLDQLAADIAMLALAPLPMIALTLLYLEHRRDEEALTPEALQHELDTLSGSV